MVPTTKSHLIGYARVSTWEQNLELQRDALEQAGCATIYEEHISGSDKELTEQNHALKALRPGDALVVWKIDRLGRSTMELLRIVDELRKRGVHFISLTEGVDTTTPNGQLIYTIIAALAEHERQRIIERTHAGLKAARARGRVGGRPRSLTAAQTKQATAMLDIMPAKDVAEKFNVGRSTLYASIKRYDPKQ